MKYLCYNGLQSDGFSPVYGRSVQIGPLSSATVKKVQLKLQLETEKCINVIYVEAEIFLKLFLNKLRGHFK